MPNEQDIRGEVKGYHGRSCLLSAVLINSCCMWLPWPHPTSRVYVCVCFLHYHNLCMCVCERVCAELLVNLSDFKALAASLLDERAVPMFIVTCFSTQGLHKKKKTSRDGGINGIKRRKRKQSGINIANRNSFLLPWGLWQWKKWALLPPVSVCVCAYLSICSVFYIISTCAGVCGVFM